MLRKLSRKLSLILRSQQGCERYNSEIIAYGLEIILGSSFKFFSIAAISILLKTFPETMLSLFAFALIRNFAGGAHCKTYCLCYLTGVPLIVMNGVLARYFIIPRMPLTLMGDLTLMAGLFIIMKWAPAGTEKKAVTETAVRVRMKQITILILGAIFLLNNAFFMLDRMNYFQAVSLGAFESLLFVTPVGYRILKAV
ncbi:MAG TPA: accessory gene regulator B family protein [Thermoanaerobacterales bacterium]|nr:accessory gene regulator B family protein [Thermoanaerobacterales bacterium]